MLAHMASLFVVHVFMWEIILAALSGVSRHTVISKDRRHYKLHILGTLDNAEIIIKH
jgi:hypothetical protein